MVYQFPVNKVNSNFIPIIFTTVFLLPFLQIQLPRTKIHLTISEAMIFITLMTYGLELAVYLAVVEVLVTTINLYRKKVTLKPRTVALNIATMVIATYFTGSITGSIFVSMPEIAINGDITVLTLMLGLMTVTQFTVNSAIVSFFISNKTGKPIWQVWNETCLNTFVIYIFNAFVAGVLVRALMYINPLLVMIAAVIFAVVFFTYRRYVDDVKETSAKAEQAERERAEQAEHHVQELKHYVAELEKTGQELRESRERFRHAAFHDSLTDLPNRNLFIETLKFLLEKQRYNPNKKFAVLFLDLNRFKTINDSLGHSMGDRLILHVAKRLMSLVREGDLAARFSGDEFAVILTDVQIADDAVQFAELIRRKILSPFTIGGRQVFTSVSIGIAFSNLAYDEAEDILRDADIAMYHAKTLNRDYIIFDQTMHTRAVKLLQVETDLRHAIERDEMLVYYQPIVDLATMNLIGFESLMRWNHPQRGIVPPNEFIPVAEETGLIIELTLWILRKSCAQMVEWQKKSPSNESLIISVNLSGKHFAQTDMIEQIRRIINETGINPKCLKLEITESAVMDNAESAIALLKKLRSLGLQLSIDDFGTGYSSLSYLHRFPIDMLKVDRSFVGTMEDGTENGEIVRTIIALAKTLNLSVIAEGIETIHQLHQLRILGCEYGQGYLFSRPVPLIEADEILNDPTRWQNVIPDNNPAIVAQNREFSQLRLAK